MRGFFQSTPFRDPQLGALERRAGKWIGTTELASHDRVELRVAGDRRAPDPDSIRLAADAPAQYAAVRADLARALLEHYEPYRDAWRRDELQLLGEEFPDLNEPNDVWAHVLVASIDVDSTRVESPIEVRLEVGWDQEHTLGAILRDATLVELNGSVTR